MSNQDPSFDQRPILIVVFAIAVILFAGRTSAADTCGLCAAPIQLDGQSLFIADSDSLDPYRRSSRPQYAFLMAGLANFDADAEADGWRADVAVLDGKDQPVAMPADAFFELKMPTSAPIVWSMPLPFESNGVATVRLPMPASYEATLRVDEDRFNWINERRRRSTGQNRTFLIDPLESRFAVPSDGRLTVRVTIASEGVFAATTFVPIRRPTLVDTWVIDR